MEFGEEILLTNIKATEILPIFNGEIENDEFNKAIRLFESGDFDDAGNILVKLREEFPNEAFPLYGTILGFYLRQDEFALNQADELVNNAPDDARNWVIKGWLYRWFQNDNQALQDFKKALKIEPSNEKAKTLMIELEAKIQKKSSDAETINEKSSRIESSIETQKDSNIPFFWKWIYPALLALLWGAILGSVLSLIANNPFSGSQYTAANSIRAGIVRAAYWENFISNLQSGALLSLLLWLLYETPANKIVQLFARIPYLGLIFIVPWLLYWIFVWPIVWIDKLIAFVIQKKYDANFTKKNWR